MFGNCELCEATNLEVTFANGVEFCLDCLTLTEDTETIEQEDN